MTKYIYCICYKDHIISNHKINIGEIHTLPENRKYFIEMKGQDFNELKNYPELVNMLKKAGWKKIPYFNLPTARTVELTSKEWTKGSNKTGMSFINALGKRPNVNYPERHKFKKRENIFIRIG